MDITAHLTSSLFSVDTVRRIEDIKFTSYDVFKYWNATVGTTDHGKTCARLRDEFDGEGDVLTPTMISYTTAGSAERSFEGYELTRTQVIRFFSRAAGSTGKTVRRMTEQYFARLEARVLEQQAELISKDSIIALLNGRHAENAMTGAFLSGIKAARCNLPMSRATIEENNKSHAYYAFVRGKEFFEMYNPRRLYNESDADFYTRVQRELDMEFISPVAPQGTTPLSEAKYQPLKLRPANQAP